MIVLIKIFDQKFRAFKSNVRLFRYCYFKNRSILSQLTWINCWRWNFRKNDFQKSNFFKKVLKKFLKKIIEKSEICYAGNNIIFCKIFENWFSGNKIFENRSMTVGICLFLRHIQRPITRMCHTHLKHLIPSKDSTHQGLWPKI